MNFFGMDEYTPTSTYDPECEVAISVRNGHFAWNREFLSLSEGVMSEETGFRL
jgi:hypothetical protein